MDQTLNRTAMFHQCRFSRDPHHQLLKWGVGLRVTLETHTLNKTPWFPISFRMHNQAHTCEREDI